MAGLKTRQVKIEEVKILESVAVEGSMQALVRLKLHMPFTAKDIKTSVPEETGKVGPFAYNVEDEDGKTTTKVQRKRSWLESELVLSWFSDPDLSVTADAPTHQAIIRGKPVNAAGESSNGKKDGYAVNFEATIKMDQLASIACMVKRDRVRVAVNHYDLPLAPGPQASPDSKPKVRRQPAPTAS